MKIKRGKYWFASKKKITQKYLRMLLHGDRLYIKWYGVIVINVPRYEGLTVKDLIKFIKLNLNFINFFQNMNIKKSKLGLALQYHQHYHSTKV